MNIQLREINELYLRIQGRYIDVPLDDWHNPTPQEEIDFSEHWKEYSHIYDKGIEKFKAIAPFLSPAEIIVGYQQGCKLLQRNLSGEMCHNFDSVYIPTMIDAIKNNELHTSYMFLQELANQLGKEIGPIVIEALDSKSTLVRETAISIAKQINLFEAAPKIRGLINDSEPEVASLAKKIIAAWDNIDGFSSNSN